MDDHRVSVRFEDLPAETISDILSYLPLDQLLAVSLLSRRLRSICSNRLLTPFAPALKAILDDPIDPAPRREQAQRLDDSPARNPFLTTALRRPWYPSSLRTLSVYSHIPRRLFIDVLVRASPEWILDALEIPRLTDREWKEVFERRFLRGWQRLRREDETWRGCYMRLLRRLVHRHTGCTHEEAWTRFITLHRNSSVSMNRIYSRTFDPLEIFRELKQQNNLASQPTQIRLVCQLQDVRILAFGVLHNPQSFHVNPNAHVLLHPPLISSPTVDGALDDDGEAYYRAARERVGRSLLGGSVSGASPPPRARHGSSPPPVVQVNAFGNGAAPAPAASEIPVSNPNPPPPAASSGSSSSRRRLLLGDRSGSSSSKRGRFFDTRGSSSGGGGGGGAGASASTSNTAATTTTTTTSQSPRSGPITGEEFLALTRSQSLTNDLLAVNHHHHHNNDDVQIASGGGGGGRPLLRPRANSSLTSAFSSILRGAASSAHHHHHHNAPATSSPSAIASSSSSLPPPAGSHAPGAGLHTVSEAAPAARGVPTRDNDPFPTPSPTTNAGLATSADSLARYTPRRRGGGGGGGGLGSGNTPSTTLPSHSQEEKKMPSTSATSPPSRPAAPRLHLPYPCMRRPQPAPGHRYYPNFTPPPPRITQSRLGDADDDDDDDDDELDRTPPGSGTGSGAGAGVTVYDAILDRPGGPPLAGAGAMRMTRNATAAAAEDDDGDYDTRGLVRVTQHERLFVRGGVGPGEDVVDAEWVEDEEETGGRAKAWVGPMLLIAQLYPATRIPSIHSSTTTLRHDRLHPPNHINGTDHTVDLGPAGMYASLEFDDLDDLAGWLDLKASEGNGGGSIRREGMGF